MNDVLKRDQNDVTVLGAITNDSNQYIKMLRVDPATGRLIVSAVIAGTFNGQLLVSAADTTYGYLFSKLTAGSGISLAITNAGGNETVQISATGTGYTTIQENGTPLTQRTKLNFKNGFAVTDNAGNTSTDVEIDESELDLGAMGGLLDLSTQVTNQLDAVNIDQSTLDLSMIGGQIDLSTQVTGILNSTNIDITNLESNLDLSNIAGLLDITNQVTGVLPLANGGTGSNLTDPNANKLWGWDDTDGAIGFWTLGTGLSYDHATHTISASAAGQTSIQFKDEGSNLGSAGTVDTIDFTGAGVTATRIGNAVTVNIPNSGGGGSGTSSNLIGTDTTTTTLTSAGIGTTETTIYTIPIPANTLSTTNAIRVTADMSNVAGGNPSGNCEFYVRYGGTIVGQMTFGSSGNQSGIANAVMETMIYADALTNAQKAHTRSLSGGNGFNFTSSSTNNSFVQVSDDTSAIDSTVLQNLTLSVKYFVANWASTTESIIVELISDDLGSGSGNANNTSFINGIGIPVGVAISSCSSGDIKYAVNNSGTDIFEYVNSNGGYWKVNTTTGTTGLMSKLGTNGTNLLYTFSLSGGPVYSFYKIDTTTFVATAMTGAPALTTPAAITDKNVYFFVSGVLTVYAISGTTMSLTATLGTFGAASTFDTFRVKTGTLEKIYFVDSNLPNVYKSINEDGTGLTTTTIPSNFFGGSSGYLLYSGSDNRLYQFGTNQLYQSTMSL